MRSADEDGMIKEMIKYVNGSLEGILLQLITHMLMDGSFDESWHATILQKLPKDGDLEELINFHPITFLAIV